MVHKVFCYPFLSHGFPLVSLRLWRISCRYSTSSSPRCFKSTRSCLACCWCLLLFLFCPFSLCVYACSKYYSKRVFKCVRPSHNVPTFTLSCTKKNEKKKKGVLSTCRTKWGRNRKKKMKATKIRGEICQHLVCALHAPRHCMSLAQCDLMQKDSRKKKEQTKMSEDGTRTVLKSWNIAGFMVPVASRSTKNPCQETLLVVFTVPSSGQLLPVKKNKTKKYIYIYIYWPGSSSPIISRLSHPSLVFFVLSLHDCAGEAVISHLQLRPSHLRSAPLFRMFSVM